MKELWKDPAYRSRQSGPHRKACCTSRMRKKRQLNSKRLWESPEYRKKNIAATKGLKRSSETRRRISLGQKALWERSHKRKKEQSGRFSGPCNPAWRGGISRAGYSHRFSYKLKRRIRCLFGNKCAVCRCPEKSKSRKNLQVHHINEDKLDCRPENLIPLCLPCHRRIHHNYGSWRSKLKQIRREVMSVVSQRVDALYRQA